MEGTKVKSSAGFSPLVRLCSILLILILTGGTIFAARGCQAEKPPGRGEAPSGYDRYAGVIDVNFINFAQAVTAQIAEQGDDPATGNRSAGSPAESKTADLIEQTMKDIGLQNVTVDQANSDGWTFRGASLDYVDGEGASKHVVLGGYQTTLQAKDEEIPLVWLGKGTAANYEGRDVRGKLVLIEIDQENDWWINYPAYQAKLKGAKAILAMSHMEEEIGNRLVSQDVCGPADAPVLAISMTDAQALRKTIEAVGVEKGGAKEISVRLSADSQVTLGAGTQNVWGEIPGKTDETILFIAHYDGYYHSYYDDASGVGLILSMAKAFIDSGYKPNRTLRFVTHGAEEWGRSDTEADWATGAWEQIMTVRPEWAGEAMGLINIDSGYPLSPMRSFDVSVPHEFQQFIEQSISSFGDRTTIRITGDGGLPSTYREDFSYNVAGIPVIANTGGEGDEKYFKSMYHSSLDTLHEGGYSIRGAIAIDLFYGYTALLLDELPIRPMNFASRFEALKASYAPNISVNGLVDAHLQSNVDRTIEIARSLDQRITAYNNEYRTAMLRDDQEKMEQMMKDAPAINKRLFNTYKIVQDEFLRLDWNMNYQFGNQGIQANIAAIDAANMAMRDGTAKEALTALMGIEFAGNAAAFDEETCSYFIRRMSSSLTDTWAEGRIVSDYCNVDQAVRSLSVKVSALEKEKKSQEEMVDGAKGEGDLPGDEGDEKGVTEAASGEDVDPMDYTQELDLLAEVRKKQEENLVDVYSRQSERLARVMDSMNAVLDLTDGLR